MAWAHWFQWVGQMRGLLAQATPFFHPSCWMPRLNIQGSEQLWLRPWIFPDFGQTGRGRSAISGGALVHPLELLDQGSLAGDGRGAICRVLQWCLIDAVLLQQNDAIDSRRTKKQPDQQPFMPTKR